MSHLTFVLSSTNEAKKQAALALLQQVYGSDCGLECVEVESGVSETPNSDEEGIQGTLSRIAAAEKIAPDRDGYLGLEGIVTTNSYGTFLCGWAAIKLKDGSIGYGCSSKVRLPDELVSDFSSFKKLSDRTAELYPDRAMLLPTLGTNGVITDGMYTRVDEFTDALRCAIGTLSL